MINGTYIFHVFETLTISNLYSAIDSIVSQTFDSNQFDFVLYNSSRYWENSERLLDGIQSRLHGMFRSFRFINPDVPTDSTLADLQWQISNIDGSDFYFTHKADFVLGDKTIQRVANLFENVHQPLYVSFCKFDVREDVNDLETYILSGRSFDRILDRADAWDVTACLPKDWETHDYRFLGYRGWDGTMHCYNEQARRNIQLTDFCSLDTVQSNRTNGIDWIFGDTRFWALHKFHALPNGRGDARKDLDGKRF